MFRKILWQILATFIILSFCLYSFAEASSDSKIRSSTTNPHASEIIQDLKHPEVSHKDSSDSSQLPKDTSLDSGEMQLPDTQPPPDKKQTQMLTTITTGSQPSQSSEKFQVEPSTGTASLTIPIDVPQGRKGIQPSLALMYNSSSANGILGVGWNLELGSVQRSTKRGVPKYDSSDSFVLVQQGSSQELVNIGGNQYRAKIEGAFMKIEFISSSYWLVTDKKGIKYYFGQTPSSQQNDGSRIFKWCLDKVQDLNSNYMTIVYFKDQNQIYPQHIYYTGNSQTGASTFADIEFVYENRSDASLSYRTGFAVTTNKRSSQILVKADNNLQRRYQLSYSNSSSSNRSILTSITQYGTDGSALPPTNFTYQTINNGLGQVSGWNIPEDLRFGHWRSQYGWFVDEGVRLADVNGDGFTDVIRYKTSSERGIYINNRTNGWYLDSSWSIPDTMQFVGDRDCYVADHGVRLADINGDGFIDFVKHYAGYGGTENVIYLNNKTNGWNLSSITMPSDTHFVFDHSHGGACTGFQQNMGVLLEDVNADGFVDIVKAGDYRRCFINNNGNGWTESPTWAPSSEVTFTDSSHTFTDVNGDGLVDIVKARSGDRRTYINTGAGWTRDSSWDMPVGDLERSQTQLVDINGDGLVDIVTASDSTREVYLNNGHGWSQDSQWSSSLSSNSIDLTDGRTRFLDANADGLIDLMRHYNWEGGRLYLNNGEANNDFSDLLNRVDNGIGAITQVNYLPSTQYDNTGSDNISDLPFPIQTVSQVSITDQFSGQQYTTNYQYRDGLFDFEDREFRGFGYVKVIDVDGNYSETEFLQDDIYKGRPKEQRSYSASGNLYTKAVNSWNYQDLGNGSKFVYLDKVDNFVFDGDSTGKRTQSQYFYEESPQYGNLTKTQELGEVAVDSGTDLDPSDNKAGFVEYAYNSGSWLLAFPKHTYLQDYQATKKSEKWFYYDDNSSFNDPPAKGNLTKDEVWCYNPITRIENRVSSIYSYDAYGNLISTTDALGRSTTITYDSTYHLFPITTTNTLSHRVINEYYGVEGVALDDGNYRGLWGQVKSSTDPNGNKGYSIYDTFGRSIKTISSFDSLEYPTSSIEYHLDSIPIKITTHQREVSAEFGTLDSVSFYDGLGRLIQAKTESEEPNKFVVSGQTEFNSRGLPYKKYLPKFSTNPINAIDPRDSNSPHATITYDPLGRLIQSTNPDGTYSNIVYDDWMTITIDENGHKQKSFFDAFGRLTKKEEYQGSDGRSPNYPANSFALYAATAYSYDTLGNLIQTQDNSHNITTISYDTLGRKVSMNDPDMGSWAYEYDALGNLVKQTDSQNQEISFNYDALNRLSAKRYTLSANNVAYTYDDPQILNSKGRLTKAAYLAQDNTKFFYDALGREIKSLKKVESQEYQVERNYDSAGRLTSLTYPDGETVNYLYNSAGQIEQVKSLASSDFSTKLLLHNDGAASSTNFLDSSLSNHTVTANGNAQLDTAQFKFGSSSSLFDGTGDYLTVADHADWNFGTGDFTIDSWVRFSSIPDNSALVTQYATDPTVYWQFHQTTGPNELQFLVYFDGASQLSLHGIWPSLVINTWYHIAVVRNGNDWYLFINGTQIATLNKSIIMPDIASNLFIGQNGTNIEYFPGGIDELRISKGIARWTSDFTPPAEPYSFDAPGTQYYVSNVDYNASGQITKIEYGNGTVTNYTYDENTLRLRHLVSRGFRGDAPIRIQDLSYQYDSAGNILEITDNLNSNHSQTFDYDKLNRLISANGVYGNKTYAYDEIGNILSKDGLTYNYAEGSAGPHAVTSLSDGTNFSYDANGNMSQITDNRGQRTDYLYDFENRLKTVKKNNQLLAEFEYDGDGGRTKKIIYPVDALSAFLNQPLETRRYVFEFKSSFMELVKAENLSNFNVDLRKSPPQRLADPSSILAENADYADNLICDHLREICDHLRSESFFNDNTDKNLKLVQVIAQNTGPLTKGINELVLAFQDIFTVKQAEADEMMSYEPYPPKIGHIGPLPITTIYVGSLLEKEFIGKALQNTTKHIFLGSQRIASVAINHQLSTINYFHTNHLGSTDVITNSSGQQVTHYEYEPYGQIVVTEGQNSTDYKFTGKPLDDETGLYYYGARYYNPLIGRFITPDTIVQNPFDPQSLNRYTYCNNNPVNVVDPTGNWSWKKFWHSFAGAFLGAVVTVLTAGWGAPLWLAGMAGGFFGGVLTGGLEGGGMGALYGGLIGGALGGLGGWGLGIAQAHQMAGQYIVGMLVVSAGATAATDSWDSFAGGLTGGLAGWAVGSGINEFIGAGQEGVNRNDLVGQTEELKQSQQALDMEPNETIRVGSRDAVLNADHQLIQRQNGMIVEMGGKNGKINVFQYNPNDYQTPASRTNLAPTQKHTLAALGRRGGVQWSNPIRVNSVKLDTLINGYQNIWSGANYAAGSFNSNYFVNTMVYGSAPSGTRITGLNTWRPSFSGIYGRDNQ